jgi:hypothetical protein
MLNRLTLTERSTSEAFEFAAEVVAGQTVIGMVTAAARLFVFTSCNLK